jgi:hypothetical protein
MEEENKYEGFDKELTLEMLRKEVVQFADDRDWNQFHQPRNLLLAMVTKMNLIQWQRLVKLENCLKSFNGKVSVKLDLKIGVKKKKNI